MTTRYASEHLRPDLARSTTDSSDADTVRLARKPLRTGSSTAPAPDLTLSRASFGGAINAGVAPDAGEAVARAGGSSGTALPGPLQRKFESSLGVDLSGVRVHTGGASQDAATSVSARAFAVGQDVHFGANQYDPGSARGEHLLAHEVAHTVQQRGGSGGAQFKLEVTGPGDSCEVEADAAAEAMVAGRPFAVGGAGAAVARDAHLTREQEHALHTVQQRSAAQLGQQSESDLVRLANTLDAARNATHGPQRETIARALVKLYDGMEANLTRRFNDGEETGIAAEIAPFTMIDVWTVDAGEARRARTRRAARRSHPAAAGGGATGSRGGATGGGTPVAAAPTADVGAAVRDASAGLELDAPHGSHAGHIMHGTAMVLEGAHTALDIALLTEAVEHGLGVGTAALFGAELVASALAVVGTVVTAAAVVINNDEYLRVGTEMQGNIIHFCAAFSHVLRGEGAGSGTGASQGARAGRDVLAFLQARGITTEQIRASQVFSALYLVAWQRVAPPMIPRLAELGHGSMPNADGFARSIIHATLPLGSAYEHEIH